MPIASEKELQQLKSRLRDLAQKSYGQNVYTFTGFLGLSEQDVFWREEAQLRHAGCTFWGGSEMCERKVLRFGNPKELCYEEDFPVVCVHVAPLQEKFADDLSHRDFLGALMNLGLERSTIGDIRVGHRQAYVFCLENIAPYICDNLAQVRHTRVRCQVVDAPELIPEEEPQIVTVQVASERLDAVVAKVYSLSRADAVGLIAAGKVYVKGRLCENASYAPKEQDVISARGYGKFIYLGGSDMTRKGKLCVRAAVYR